MERGASQALKNLRALRASVRNFLYLPCRFRSHGDHKGHGEGSRKSVKKPLREILPLMEIPKDTKRGSVKALKNLCALCASVRNFLYLPRRFRSHGGTEDTKRGSVKALKNLCALCASVRNFLYLPCRFRSHGDHKGHGEGSSPSIEKPLCPPCLRAKLLIPSMPF